MYQSLNSSILSNRYSNTARCLVFKVSFHSIWQFPIIFPSISHTSIASETNQKRTNTVFLMTCPEMQSFHLLRFYWLRINASFLYFNLILFSNKHFQNPLIPHNLASYDNKNHSSKKNAPFLKWLLWFIKFSKESNDLESQSGGNSPYSSFYLQNLPQQLHYILPDMH